MQVPGLRSITWQIMPLSFSLCQVANPWLVISPSFGEWLLRVPTTRPLLGCARPCIYIFLCWRTSDKLLPAHCSTKLAYLFLIGHMNYDLRPWSWWHTDPCKFCGLTIRSSSWTCLSSRRLFQSEGQYDTMFGSSSSLQLNSIFLSPSSSTSFQPPASQQYFSLTPLQPPAPVPTQRIIEWMQADPACRPHARLPSPEGNPNIKTLLRPPPAG